MKMRTKVLGAAAAVTIAAGTFATLAPSSNATVYTIGTCGNNLRALGTAKSTTAGKGITDSDDLDVSIGTKGVDPTVNKGTTFGSCTFNSGYSTPDGSKPPVKGFSGSHAISKWGTKLFSPEADCNTVDTGDVTEWPINGKLSFQWDAGTQKEDAYIVVRGFTDPDNDPNSPSDVVSFDGVVIKGVAAGADVAGDSMFDPIVKDKTQVTATPYFGYQFDIGSAAGCADDQIGANANNANILAFVNGANSGVSDLLALPVAPITWSIGS